jgi:sensor histidine kinase YesM
MCDQVLVENAVIHLFDLSRRTGGVIFKKQYSVAFLVGYVSFG